MRSIRHCVLAILALSWLACARTITTSPDGARDAAFDERPESPDVPEVFDVTEAGDGSDDTAPPIASPRLIAPLSGARVTMLRPTFHWLGPPGVDGVSIDICADRNCTEILQTFTAAGDQGRPPTPLRAGLLFWRARSVVGGSMRTPPSAVWEFFAPRVDGVADTSFDTVPDFNGDGVADIAVAMGRYDDDSGGTVRVFLGRRDALPTMPDITVAVPNVNTVANAGDMDGDGYADLAVRTIGAGMPERLEIHRGGPSGPSARADYLITWAGGNVFHQFTIALGDVNADGYADIATESPDHPLSFGTRFEIYHGHRDGPSLRPDSVIDGGSEWTSMGTPVRLGDMDGDGFADLAVADYAGFVMGNPNAVIPAVVRVFRGSPGGLRVDAPISIHSPEANDLGFGGLIRGAADLNADGYGDLVIAASAVPAVGDAGVSLPWRLYAYAGRPGFDGSSPSAICALQPGDDGVSGPGGMSAGDFDQDGFDDVVVASTGRASEHIQLVRGTTTWLPSTSSQSFLATGGFVQFVPLPGRDLDGDGVEDLLGATAIGTSFGTLPVSVGFQVLRSTPAGLLDPTPAANVVLIPVGDGIAFAIVD